MLKRTRTSRVSSQLACRATDRRNVDMSTSMGNQHKPLYTRMPCPKATSHPLWGALDACWRRAQGTRVYLPAITLPFSSRSRVCVAPSHWRARRACCGMCGRLLRAPRLQLWCLHVTPCLLQTDAPTYGAPCGQGASIGDHAEHLLSSCLPSSTSTSVTNDGPMTVKQSSSRPTASGRASSSQTPAATPRHPRLRQRAPPYCPLRRHSRMGRQP